MATETSTIRTEQDLEEHLVGLLEASEDEDLGLRSVATFADVGMLTRNRGLVVGLRNGAEFQVTIVQSQEAEGADEGGDEDE